MLPVVVLFALAIVGYVVTLTLYSSRLRVEQQRAETAQQFMVELLSSPDPFAPADPERGRNITVVEALEIGRKRLDSQLEGQPELKATLLGSIAGVYSSLDQSVDAIELGEQALALNTELYGEASEPVLDNLRLLASRYDALDEYDRARELYDRQLSVSRELYDVRSPQLAAAEIASGIFEVGQGELEAGSELLLHGIEILREDPEAHARLFITAVNSSVDQDGMYDAEAYVPLLAEARAVSDSVFGPDSLYTANVLLAIARNDFYLGEFEQAKATYDIGLEIFDEQLGTEHRDALAHWNNYGFLLMGMRDDAGAEAVHREVIDRAVNSHGENNRLVADNYQNLGGAINRQGRYEEALRMHRKAHDIYKNVLEQDHYIAVFPLLSIAYIELQRNNGAAAEAAAADALSTFRETVPGTYLEGVALCLVGLGKEQSGNAEEGASLILASHEIMQPVPQNIVNSPYYELCRLAPSNN